MTSGTASQPLTSNFGARAAGPILAAILISYVLADYALVELLGALRERVGLVSLSNRTDSEIAALRLVIHGFQDPLITLLVCMLMLRRYFPEDSSRMLLSRFGLKKKFPLKNSVACFAAGMLYLMAFKSLAYFLPPGPFVAANPINVINAAAFSGKLTFAICAITIVPVTEEFLFRGVLYNAFGNSWGKVASAICVSLIFIALHPDTLESGYWVTHSALYVFPLFMVLMREITGTLHGPMLAHSAFNFTEIYF